VTARQKERRKERSARSAPGTAAGRERSLETGRLAVLRLLGESSTLKNQLAQVDEYLAGIEREKSACHARGAIRGVRPPPADGVKGRCFPSAGPTANGARIHPRARRRAEEDLASRKRTAGESRQAIDALRAEAGGLKARRDSLERNSVAPRLHHRLGQAVVQRDPAGRRDGIPAAGVLADFVEVDPTYEKAAEEFLHDELEYVVAKDWETGRARGGFHARRY